MSTIPSHTFMTYSASNIYTTPDVTPGITPDITPNIPPNYYSEWGSIQEERNEKQIKIKLIQLICSACQSGMLIKLEFSTKHETTEEIKITCDGCNSVLFHKNVKCSYDGVIVKRLESWGPDADIEGMNDKKILAEVKQLKAKNAELSQLVTKLGGMEYTPEELK